MKLLGSLLQKICRIFILLGVFLIIYAFHPQIMQYVSHLLSLERDGTPEWYPDGGDVQVSDISDRIDQILHSNGISLDEIGNGYMPVQGENEQVTDGISISLPGMTGRGETGDDLSFDTEYYPYYGMLDEASQSVYRQIYANTMAVNAAFVPVKDVTVEQLKNIFNAVYNDHPELFWLDTSYSCKYRWNGICAEIGLQFNETAADLNASREVFEARAAVIIAGAQNAGDYYEKERYVHDALIAGTAYDLDSEVNQSAYSALVNGRAVCAGYARAFQYLMQRIGIPCYYCTGYSGENHAWNIVKLGERYLNVDTTWNDTGFGRYDYFNRTDAEFAQTHIRRDLSVNLPECV